MTTCTFYNCIVTEHMYLEQDNLGIRCSFILCYAIIVIVAMAIIAVGILSHCPYSY